MSGECDRIRQKFRQQIRSRQISDLLRVTRIRNVNDEKTPTNSNIFIEMNKKILSSAKLPIEMKLVEELIDLIQKYPEHQNTYALIGNYLIEHGDAHIYFGLRLLGVSQLSKKLENYRWVLMIMLSKMQQLNKYMLQQYDITMSEILKESTQQHEINESFNILNIILNLQNISKQQKYFPSRYIQQFFHKITYCNIKEFKYDVVYSIIMIMHIVGEYHLENKVVREFVPEIVKILILGISQYPTFRYDFVVYLKRLTYDNFDEIEEILKKQIGKQMVIQLMYLYENIYNERVNILLIFQCWIRELQFENIIYLLNIGFHEILISRFNTNNSQQLRLCLQVILLLFNRLNQRQQKQILDHVIDSMDQKGLSKYLLQCMENRQESNIQKLLTQILDSYFSDQIS